MFKGFPQSENIKNCQHYQEVSLVLEILICLLGEDTEKSQISMPIVSTYCYFYILILVTLSLSGNYNFVTATSCYSPDLGQPATGLQKKLVQMYLYYIQS